MIFKSLLLYINFRLLNNIENNEYAYTTGDLGTPTDTIVYGYTDAEWGDLLTSYDWKAIRYDGIGNPTTYRGYTMSWLGRRLTSASGNGNTLSYTYDENGLRAQKTVNGTATQYRYHGTTLLSQVKGNDKLLFSYDANGDVVSVNFNGTYYYYLRNAQGDIVKIIDGNNNSVVEYTYDSWGKPISTTGTLASTLGAQNPFRYRGYVYDEETGFYYLQSRYYDPETGRFLNVDSAIAGVGGNIRGYNIFAYCMNNPVNMVDYAGCWPDWIDIKKYVAKTYINPFMEALEEGTLASGDWTVAGGITGSASFGAGISLSFGYICDSKGNVGKMVSVSGGGKTPDLSASAFVTVTNAPDIEYNNGLSTQVGGSMTVGVEQVSFVYGGTAYHGTTISLGAGVIPAELHGEVAYTVVYDVYNIFEEWDAYYKKLMGE